MQKAKKIKFKEITSRLTGISCPIFGVSWRPPKSECSIAKKIITFLEDRRVLFVPSHMECPDHCVQSILKIREFLTQEISNLNKENELKNSLRAMRAACRKFLNTVNADKNIILYGSRHGRYASWTFNGAIGELRGVFGVHIARIAAQYGLDIEEELASILPEKEE